MSDDTEKLLIFNRLQRLLKDIQTGRAGVSVFRTVDYGYGDIFREESHQLTDELNGLLAKIRDWEGNHDR